MELLPAVLMHTLQEELSAAQTGNISYISEGQKRHAHMPSSCQHVALSLRDDFQALSLCAGACKPRGKMHRPQARRCRDRFDIAGMLPHSTVAVLGLPKPCFLSAN